MIGTHDLVFASLLGLIFGFVGGFYFDQYCSRSYAPSNGIQYMELPQNATQSASESENIVIEGFKGGYRS